MIKVVLFDLDGTLLPMDQELFIGTYFKKLAARMAHHGHEPEGLIKAVWKGTAAMIQNNGEKTNEQAFWDAFAAIYGEGALADMPLFEEFYRTEFPSVRSVSRPEPMAAEIVHRLRERGIRTVLATNPVFPAVATESRMEWAGLSPADFELYTTYENIGYCKPNPAYYEEIVRRLGVLPEECLMVGNDVEDDMVAATLGMEVFLLTRHLINKSGADIGAYPHGDFDALAEFLDKLNS